jgi:hypothetical protein
LLTPVIPDKISPELLELLERERSLTKWGNNDQ